MADTQTEGQAPRPIEELSFKEASIELEHIVRALEKNDIELEDALSAYARGAELVKSLRARMADAEQRVRVLQDQLTEPTVVGDTTSAPATAFLDER